MKVEIKNIRRKDIIVAAELLTKNFVEDKGVMVLFKENDPKYDYKVNQWFKATLKMLVNDKQNINCAFWGDELVGVSIVSHTTYKPSVLSLLKWTYAILIHCGMKTVKQSAKHDKNRKSSFTNTDQYILEFIAVNAEQRGKGIGRRLFESLDDLSDSKKTSVWLETTKKKNIEIFNKMNYHLIGTKNELSVEYYIMTNEKNGRI